MTGTMRARFGAVAAAMVVAGVMAQPAGAQLTSPCEVADGGRIIAANGDPATFGGSAGTSRTRLANQVYVDHGPATPFRFHSILTTAVVCDPDARRADLAGTGIVETEAGSEQVVQYVIRLFDAGELPVSGFDSYGITLSNGYNSGEQLVRQGNIQIFFR